MTQLEDLGRRIARLEKALGTQQRASRLGSASLDDAALTVNGPNGSLRAIIGQQADGTTALNVVNGGPPPAPSTPTAESALGGIAAGWDGKFTGGAVIPLDWSRVEVHASATSGFTADATTLQATIETPQGAGVYLPATAPLYVVLLARNTSGTASAPTAQVGPVAPRTIVDTDVADGSITETKIANDAISTPKIKAGAIQTAQLDALAVTTAKLAAGSVDAVALSATAITGKTITGGTVTGSTVQTGTTGARITLNDASDNSIKVYNSTGTLTTSIGGPNAALSQIAGAIQTSLVNGGLFWDDLGAPGQTPGITSNGSSSLTIASGYAGGGGGNLALNAVYNQGDTSLGVAHLPNLTLIEAGGVYQANMLISGYALKTDVGGIAAEIWQTPTYNANWSAATSLGTLTPMTSLRYRAGVQDDLVVEGCFTAASGAGNSITNLPVSYRPKANTAPFTAFARTSAGAVSTVWLYISPAGNINFDTRLGSTPTATVVYSIPRTHLSLGNID